MERAWLSVMRFLSIPSMIFFILLLSVSERHELLFSTTYDFIIVGKSSPLAVFIMFNLIFITVLIIGSPKPVVHHQDADGLHEFTSPSPPPLALEYIDIVAKDEEGQSRDDIYDGTDVEDVEWHHGYDGYDEENDDDLDTEDDEDSEEEEDEEDNNALERRSEELIAKVKQKWREELLTEKPLCITAS